MKMVAMMMMDDDDDDNDNAYLYSEHFISSTFVIFHTL